MALFADRYSYRPPKIKMANRQAILWPVYAWRIVYPNKLRLGANLFQEAIMGLMRTGTIDLSKIAELLALDVELVRLIVATQLEPNGWIDSRGEITSDGLRLLDDAEDSRANLSAGYSFQDAVSGDWIPRFTTDLSEISPNITSASNRPTFLLDKNKGTEIAPFLVRKRAEPNFDLDKLKEAFALFRRDKVLSSREQGIDSDDSFHMQVIERVDQSPTPIYLMCELYRDENADQPWLVSDPFRLRKAVSWLRKPMLALAKSDPSIAKKLQSMLPEISSANSSVDDWLKQVEEQTNFDLTVDFDFILKHELIAKYLGSVLRQLKKIESQKSQINGEEVRSLLNDIPSLVEAVLTWVLQRWSISVEHWPKEWASYQAEQELRNLNVPGITSAVIKKLSRQKRRDVAIGIKRQGQALKALLAGSLFCADQHDSHPYKNLTSESLNFERIIEITDLRNRDSAHASLGTVAKEKVCTEAKFVIEWLTQFKPWY